MTQLFGFEGSIRFQRRTLKSCVAKKMAVTASTRTNPSFSQLPRDVLIEIVTYIFASSRDVFNAYSTCRSLHDAVVLAQNSLPFEGIDKWTHACAMAASWSEGANVRFGQHESDDVTHCNEFVISDMYRQALKEKSEVFQPLALECAATLPKINVPRNTSVIPTNSRGSAWKLKGDELYLSPRGEAIKAYGIEVWLVYLIRRIFHARGYIGNGAITWIGEYGNAGVFRVDEDNKISIDVPQLATSEYNGFSLGLIDYAIQRNLLPHFTAEAMRPRVVLPGISDEQVKEIEAEYATRVQSVEFLEAFKQRYKDSKMWKFNDDGTVDCHLGNAEAGPMFSMTDIDDVENFRQGGKPATSH